MNPLILVCEDNPDVLFTIKIALEFHNYEVFTATNGKEAIKVLSEAKILPHLILSDIMMPEMDGYEFFKTVSENPSWSQIPFLFLTACASPEDVRFGHLLGIDDYITKPFKHEDLLAIIAGKITRKNRIDEMRKQIGKEIISSLNFDWSPSLSDDKQNSISLLFMSWDESLGPKLNSCYPKNEKHSNFLEKVGTQLFHAAVSIYGQTGLYKAQGILLRVVNIDEYGYIFFDSLKDETVRGGHRLFLIAVIAPKINFFESLKINEIFQRISRRIKESDSWDNWPIEKYTRNISKILSTSLF